MLRSSAVSFLAFVTLASLLLRCRADEVTCYAPDGITVAPNDSYVPCNKLGITQQGVYSSCCLLDGDPQARDLCAQSGLCLRGGIIQREYCTDKQWKSPACVPVCLDPKVRSSTPINPQMSHNHANSSTQWGGSVNGTVELTPCTDGTFCCGKNNLTCCGSQYAVSVTTQASVVVVQTATTTATPSGVPGIAAVAGLGAGLGVVILVSIGIIVCLRRRNTALALKNASLPSSTGQLDPNLPSPTLRPMSFMPSSAAPTLIAPSSHVPSMQDFAAFKAFMGYQSATEVAGNPQRYSELDATNAATARHLSRLSVQTPVGFEQFREASMERETHQGLSLPAEPPPGVPVQGTQGA